MISLRLDLVPLRTNPLSASTTKPVASLVRAGSVSKEHVWQKRIDTTLRTTLWMVACHSAVSATVGRRADNLGSSYSSYSPSKSSGISGVLSPPDRSPFGRWCLGWRPSMACGGSLRLERAAALEPFMVSAGIGARVAAAAVDVDR
jgi:hypothetical protein